MPFLAAGDPDVSTTVELIRLLAACGVDLIEVGFPYSDPIADGPVIQEAYTRALGKKIRLPDIFAGLEALHSEKVPPLLAMVAYAIVYRAGPEKFAAMAQRAGFAGLIVPDLPGDQASELFAIARAHNSGSHSARCSDHDARSRGPHSQVVERLCVLRCRGRHDGCPRSAAPRIEERT